MQLKRGGERTCDAAGAGHLHAFQHGADIGYEFSGAMRFSQKAGHACGKHTVEPFLRDKTRAQKNDDIGANCAETAKSFFTVHERHREIEQD